MSDNTVLLLPHQERFLQSRKNFTDIRWHFLLAGYGAGKSRSLAISVLDIVYELDGEKDDGGLYAKIIVGGYTYAHLEQTLMIDLMAYLDASKTPYHEDTKNHILTIGTVQVIFVQLLEPGKIFGQSVYCALCVDGDAIVKVHTGYGHMQEVPLKQIAPGDLIMTRYGLKKVVAKKCSGYRPCIKTNGVYTTVNHPFKVYNRNKHKEEVRKANKLDENCMLIHEDNTLSSVFQDKTLVEKEVWDITVEEVHEFLAKGTDEDCQYLSLKNCDEIDELPEETMIEAMKSISQRVRQVMPNHRSPFIMAASTAQGMKGFYRLYCHYKKSGIGFVLTRARTQDNWYLPKEYILDLWKNFTETERKVYMEGAFLSVTQGRVIPGFDWDRNFEPESDMDLELIPGERVYIGQDFNSGYNRGSAWVARGGILHCIKRYDFPDADDMANIYRYDFPEQDIFWLPDVTIKDQYPHFARSLRKNDIHIIHRSKSPLVEDSCFLISKLCAQGRIMIHSQAREVAEAFSTASRGKDNKIPKGVGPNSPIHDIDGARYVCSYLALVLPEFKDIRRGIMSHLASFRAGAQEVEERKGTVRELLAGYTRIEGRAFTER